MVTFSVFIIQVLYVVWLLWFQSQVDIFLLDWERPRASQSNQTGGGENSVAMAPVSIWRTYFIANEWNEIQVWECNIIQNSNILILHTTVIKKDQSNITIVHRHTNTTGVFAGQSLCEFQLFSAFRFQDLVTWQPGIQGLSSSQQKKTMLLNTVKLFVSHSLHYHFLSLPQYW